MKILFSLAACFCLFLSSCGKTRYIEVNKLPDTYQCAHMEEICKEAREFESKYSQMSEEEKEEFKTLRDTYRDQCNTALEQCKKSAP
ncbi:MAG: hypothetical protein GX267_12630 [Fibrobacter sp.]|jgi:hypothetical protein|nr:hypothetical protein [Fibrobacter sp.]